jgi:branched-chain amino acid transport system ATP-binding protein
MSMLKRSDCHPPAATEDILSICNVSASYGRIQVLYDVSLRLGKGQLVSLIGANGAGKTTLLRLISGLLRCTAGTVYTEGADITRMLPHERVKLGICQVPEGRQIFGPMTVEDNLLLGGYLRLASDRHEALQQIYRLYPVLDEKRRVPAMTLSGGQQQMLAIGRALMGKPRILLLDEPSMGLSPLLVQNVFATIQQLRSDGLSILLIEQNAEAALSIADVGYVLEAGRIVMSGPGSDILSDDRVQKAYLGV